jgi:phosphoribosylformylglycinamidine cyclo-ligase
LVKGAKKSAMPIVGGETAIMSDLISGKGFGFDLAGMVVGILSKKEMVLGDKIKPNDVIIGIQSSGLHSNGYSLARKALLSKYSVKDNIKGVGNLGNALLRPTEIYVKPVLEALKKCKINGLAHITGGSFTKLLRLKKIGYHLDNMPKTPALMQLIEDTGVKNEEMYKTFNMGVGFCIISPENQVKDIHKILNKHKMKSYEIGRISKNKGVFINKLKIA